MRTDHQLQNAVLDHLDCNPFINSSHIGVVARDGVVTLTGHVPSLGEKRAAEVAAGQVRGARAIVDQITVELPGSCRTTDEQIAERAFSRLASNVAVPKERIQISVEKGIVTLRGDVDWQHQRQAAVDDLRQLDGVRDIRNEIVIKPPVEPEQVREKVHEALSRCAPLDAGNVGIRAEGGRVILFGTVNSWHERGLAESAAWSVPGVTEVVDDLVVA